MNLINTTRQYSDNVLSAVRQHKYPIANASGFFIIGFLFIAQFANEVAMAKATAVLLILWLPFLLLEKKSTFSSSEYVFIGICAFYFLSALPSYFISIDVNKANGELEKLAKWAVIPAATLFILHRTTLKRSLLIGLFTLAVLPIVGCQLFDFFTDHTGLSTYGNRNIGGYLSVGILAVLSGLLLLGNTIVRATLIVLIVLTGFAVIQFETRGTWLALPAIVLVAAFAQRHYLKRITLPQKAVITAILIAATLAIGFSSTFQSRVEKAATNIDRYIENAEEFGGTSVGIRLELYHAGWAMAKDYPLTGIGLGDMKYYITEYDRYFHIISNLGYSFSMHSEYFQALTYSGFISLFTLLTLMIWLTVYYCRSRPSDDQVSHALRYSGLALTLTTAIVCLTLNMLSNNTGLNFFVISNSLLIFMIERQRRSKSHRYAYSTDLQSKAT